MVRLKGSTRAAGAMGARQAELTESQALRGLWMEPSIEFSVDANSQHDALDPLSQRHDLQFSSTAPAKTGGYWSNNGPASNGGAFFRMGGVFS